MQTELHVSRVRTPPAAREGVVAQWVEQCFGQSLAAAFWLFVVNAQRSTGQSAKVEALEVPGSTPGLRKQVAQSIDFSSLVTAPLDEEERDEHGTELQH